MDADEVEGIVVVAVVGRVGGMVGVGELVVVNDQASLGRAVDIGVAAKAAGGVDLREERGNGLLDRIGFEECSHYPTLLGSYSRPLHVVVFALALSQR